METAVGICVSVVGRTDKEAETDRRGGNSSPSLWYEEFWVQAAEGSV
jgi:hypothetical protein